MLKFINALASDDNKDIKLDDLSVESAKSDWIFDQITQMGSANEVAKLQMTNCLKNQPLNHMKDMMAAVLKVTMADVERVLKKYVQPMFSPTTGAARIVITSNPAQIPLMVKGFEEMGVQVEQVDMNKDLDTLE